MGAAKPRPDMLDMAKQFIQSRSHPFDPASSRTITPRCFASRQAQSRGRGSVAVEDEADAGAKVIDFMEALKRSLRGGEAKAAEPEAAPKKPASESESRGAGEGARPQDGEAGGEGDEVRAETQGRLTMAPEDGRLASRPIAPGGISRHA